MEIEIVAAAAGLTSIGVIVAVLVLALRANDAERRASEAAIDAANTKAQLAIATATIATKTNEADSERNRANALDDALAQAETEIAGDPATAMQRLLSRWKTTRTATGAAAVSAARAVPSQSTPAAVAGDRDGLLKLNG